ncbi:MAG: preprotein translocase subunit YajC [Synergistaceae bacterium]|nr:preprotein translocase subunit YajC [Synergistaceae bacterium]
MLFPLAIFVLIFYFFIIRPQKKRDKQHNNMIAGINRGDQIVTIGGFFGTVREVRDDNSFLIELTEGVRVKILKSAVQTKVTPSAASTATTASLTEKENQGAKS